MRNTMIMMLNMMVVVVIPTIPPGVRINGHASRGSASVVKGGAQPNGTLSSFADLLDPPPFLTMHALLPTLNGRLDR